MFSGLILFSSEFVKLRYGRVFLAPESTTWFIAGEPVSHSYHVCSLTIDDLVEGEQVGIVCENRRLKRRVVCSSRKADAQSQICTGVPQPWGIRSLISTERAWEFGFIIPNPSSSRWPSLKGNVTRPKTCSCLHLSSLEDTHR